MGARRLTDAALAEMRERWKAGDPVSQIAAAALVSVQTVRNYCENLERPGTGRRGGRPRKPAPATLSPEERSRRMAAVAADVEELLNPVRVVAPPAPAKDDVVHVVVGDGACVVAAPRAPHPDPLPRWVPLALTADYRDARDQFGEEAAAWLVRRLKRVVPR